MKNIQNKLLICSCIVLAAGCTIIGYKAYNNWIWGLFSMFMILIPAIYSLIPLFKEQLKQISIKKNRYTDSTFTDRKEDIKIIISKLITKEHILEIKGREEQSGKTWLAKRLCDYINFPKDTINLELGLKCPYNRAFYIDMNDYVERDINNFFKENIVDINSVLIFDHVTDLKILISKQTLYHFQMVYILKNLPSRDFSSHIISDFDPNYIKELQDKIKNIYPEVSCISKNEIEILFQLTDGNIGKIVKILSEQKCINWIKDIAGNRQTEYDKKLNKIQAVLYSGQYKKAENDLENFKKEYKTCFDENNDLNYKYIMMLSDCKHLLNHYEEAIAILSTIDNIKYSINNSNYKVELYKAHYYKHLWKCNESLAILQRIKKNSYTAMVDALGILAAKYFINDLFVPDSENNSLEELLNFYLLAKNSILPHSDEETNKLRRCTAIYLYYKEYPSKCDTLIYEIERVISIYKAQNNRLLANAYFIRGEIYRLYKNYEQMVFSYKQCLNVTEDNNIIIQTNLMIYYLVYCKKIDLEFELLNDQTIINMCEKNNYAKKVWKRLNCIKLNDPNSHKIQNCFETRIMPIL